MERIKVRTRALTALNAKLRMKSKGNKEPQRQNVGFKNFIPFSSIRINKNKLKMTYSLTLFKIKFKTKQHVV